MKIRDAFLTTLVAAGLVSLAAKAAEAPAPGPAQAPPPAQAQAQAPAKPAAAPAAKATKKVEIDCESTASRIHRTKAEDCARSTQPTTNYYKHDLERTPQVDLGQSLKQLDPRFQ